jgi:hypothetical protein
MSEPPSVDRVPSGARQDGSSGTPPNTSRPESRMHLRFRIDDSSVNLFLKGFLSSLGLGKSNKARAAINLSEGGVMLLMREFIPKGSKVTVRIDMEKYSDFIETAGEVRWCEQSARSAKDYYAGIRFIGLGEAEIKKIGQMREWFNSPEYKTRIATRRPSGSPRIDTGS